MSKPNKQAKEYFIDDTQIKTPTIQRDVEGQKPKENIIFYKRFLRFKERHKAERVALFFLLLAIIIVAIVVITWIIIWSQQDIHHDQVRPVAEILYKNSASQQASTTIFNTPASDFFTLIKK